MPNTAQIINTPIADAYVFTPKIFPDERGYFLERYREELWQKKIANFRCLQENTSLSKQGVLRGLHFQKPPHTQAKLVSVLQGKILDVIVDLRRNSQSFGQYFAIELSAENHKQLFVPQGCAHGFYVQSTEALVIYKCDNYYHAEAESGLRFDDSELNIAWGYQEKPLISAKDLQLPSWHDYLQNSCF